MFTLVTEKRHIGYCNFPVSLGECSYNCCYYLEVCVVSLDVTVPVAIVSVVVG